MLGGMGERVQGRLERLGMTPEKAAREAGITVDGLGKLLDGRLTAIRGRRLVRLAEVLATSVGYLVGLDPDEAVPEEWLLEEQGQLGMLAGDEDVLLRAYRRLDVSSRAALLQVATKMAPKPEALERKAKQIESDWSALSRLPQRLRPAAKSRGEDRSPSHQRKRPSRVVQA